MARDEKKVKSVVDGDAVKSISKSQKQRAARLSKMKGKQPIQRGGVCSSCGQESTSCTTNTSHASCEGHFTGTFQQLALALYHKNNYMTADGIIIREPLYGTWISKADLETRQYERAAQLVSLAKSRVVMTSVFKTDASGRVFDRLDVRNGLDEPIHYVDGVWCVLEEPSTLIDEYTAGEMEVLWAAAQDAAEELAQAPIHRIPPVTDEELEERMRYIDGLDLPPVMELPAT